MENGKLRMENYLTYRILLVLMMLTNKLMISSLSKAMDEKLLSSKYSLSFNSSSQYKVSLASFKATCILWIKSALDSACSLSLTKAPIAVPERSSGLLNTYSFFSSIKYLYSLTIRRAKAYDLVWIGRSSLIARQDKKFSTLNRQAAHSQFSTHE